ncbi:transglycosylase SLT domain-containing protein [Dictyobacter arantiisoli]|uniref:LysM domain-containing protein n=1 Tax=Dictyobacter arantiisoli TaxID=2014874 RepID=A0A5A5T973_9CHLR|nr:transglycosylase SLT domain-containing protein [Dictyobacter arantiisoli]GCF08041.1 hypothetical protein KDI_16050 [Dictyobacter arantiisoli]
MEQTPPQKVVVVKHISWSKPTNSRHSLLQSTVTRQALLLLCTTLLLLGSLVTSQHHHDAYAQFNTPNSNISCAWHRIIPGDTLIEISHYYRANLWAIVHINGIRNINLIYTGQSLCIPHPSYRGASGLLPGGQIRWYAYNALERSSQQQVIFLLRRAAARHRLPARLLLAVAWQESGWTQHVIAHDGGIGAMQLMPYTVQALNQQVHGHYDPYKLADNIELGTIYLHNLWHGFHGNLTRIISAYNEGGWNVQHRGIFNWSYVNNVRALMSHY